MAMSDDELLAAIAAAEDSAIGGAKGEIATDRADAIDRYYGKSYGDETPGRSTVVSRDVSDVVEGVLANVLKPFVAGDRLIEFQPRGPEDTQQAQQESDFINFTLMERNNGFILLNSVCKDALLLRVGYAKAGWTKREDVMFERYVGLSDEEVSILVGDKAVQVVEHSEYPDPFWVPQMPQPGPSGQPPQPMPPQQQAMLHDLKLKRAAATEYVKIDPVPPDEILVSVRLASPCLQDADFVQHRTHLSISEIRELGYEVDDDINDDDTGETSERIARDRFGEMEDALDDSTSDPARRVVTFKETWLRIDRNGDGKAELRRVCSVGLNLLADEDADMIPLAAFAAVAMPHQHLGVSVYDMVADLARIKTALMRQYLDNLYLANNSRSVVDVDRVNMDDLLSSRPGGVVRTTGDPASSVMPLIAPNTGANALQGLEYMDSVRENRTGYTRYAQGMDSDSLINKTATGLAQVMSQSQMRLELIARTIAETGVKDLFRIVHALTLKHSTKSEKVKLRNEWVQVNPREWVNRYDMSISVGLGTASQTQQMQNLMLLAQAQEKSAPMGLVSPENAFNLLSKLANAAGFKNPSEFFSKPEGPPPERKDPLVQAEEVKAQAMLQGKQMEGQISAQENAQKAQIDERQLMLEDARERDRMAAEFEFKRWEAQLQVEADLQKAQIAAAAEQEKAQMTAAVEQQKAQIGADGERQRAEIAIEGSTKQRTEREQAQALLSQISAAIAELRDLQEAPREIVRGPDGRAMGVRVGNKVRNIARGPDGRVTGIQ